MSSHEARAPAWPLVPPAGRPYRMALLNPNTSRASTDRMVANARQLLPAGVQLEGFNVASGEEFIADPQALARAAEQVALRGAELVAAGFDALIVAAFGDPGLALLRARWSLPVTGLGEAGIAAAARGGLRYAIVTVTPGLHDSLVRAAQSIAPDGFVGVRYTPGAPEALMRSPEALGLALLAACREAVRVDGAQSIVIGGGPLAHVAPGIAAQLQLRVVDPVDAAVRLAIARGPLSFAG